MNNKIAMALIIGALFAILAGLHTVEKKYYVWYRDKVEVSKEVYIKEKEKNPDLALNRRTNSWERNKYPLEVKNTYSPMFIVIGFLGGVGTGYLTASALEAGISRLRRRRKHTPAITEK